MDKEAWCAVVHGVTKSQTWLSNWTELKYFILFIAMVNGIVSLISPSVFSLLVYGNVRDFCVIFPRECSCTLEKKVKSIVFGWNAVQILIRSNLLWTQWEDCGGKILLHMGRGSSLEFDHADTLILDFQPPELWEVNFCFLWKKKKKRI